MSVGVHAVTSSVIPRWDRKLLFEILNNIHDVVLVIDSDTTIVYANEAYARILGVPVGRVLGRRLDKIEPNSKTITALRTGRVSNNGRDYLDSLGIDVVGSSFPLYDGKNIIGAVSIFKNITEVVHLNRELQLTKGVANYFKEQLEQREQLPLSFKEYVGQNSRLKETLILAAKVALTDSTVLILGESGVGKGVLARAVHNASRRKDRPLIKVNCAAIPENLLKVNCLAMKTVPLQEPNEGGNLANLSLLMKEPYSWTKLAI